MHRMTTRSMISLVALLTPAAAQAINPPPLPVCEMFFGKWFCGGIMPPTR